MKITWLGHSGFRIEIGDQVLLVDPWLTGNPTLSLEFVDPYQEPTTHPQVFDNNLTNLSEGRAMHLPGVGNDYVFVPAADFQEHADGQATLTGKLARLADLDDGWDLAPELTDGDFTGRGSFRFDAQGLVEDG